MSHAIILNEWNETEGRAAHASGSECIKSVLFVCRCNVCRSPAAKSVFEKYLKSQKLEAAYYLDSAGVNLDENPPAPSFSMRWTAFRRGYRLKKRARKVRRPDLNRFDLVIAMDQQNLDILRSMHSNPSADIRLLSDFLPVDAPANVPDPMNRSRQTCHLVFDLLEQACPSIVECLMQGETTKSSAR